MLNEVFRVNTGGVVLVAVVTIFTTPPFLRWKYVFLPSCIARDSFWNAVRRRRIGWGFPVKFEVVFACVFRFHYVGYSRKGAVKGFDVVFECVFGTTFYGYGEKGTVTEFKCMTLWTIYSLCSMRFFIFVDMVTALQLNFSQTVCKIHFVYIEIKNQRTKVLVLFGSVTPWIVIFKRVQKLKVRRRILLLTKNSQCFWTEINHTGLEKMSLLQVKRVTCVNARFKPTIIVSCPIIYLKIGELGEFIIIIIKNIRGFWQGGIM